jgi:hypothetical protein
LLCGVAEKLAAGETGGLLEGRVCMHDPASGIGDHHGCGRVLSPADSRVRRSDMLEQPTAKDAGDGAVATAAWEIVTVRTER